MNPNMTYTNDVVKVVPQMIGEDRRIKNADRRQWSAVNTWLRTPMIQILRLGSFEILRVSGALFLYILLAMFAGAWIVNGLTQ